MCTPAINNHPGQNTPLPYQTEIRVLSATLIALGVLGGISLFTNLLPITFEGKWRAVAISISALSIALGLFSAYQTLPSSPKRSRNRGNPAPQRDTAFTIASYNCGDLKGDRDYYMSAVMKKLMTERQDKDKPTTDLAERVQDAALQNLFGGQNVDLTSDLNTLNRTNQAWSGRVGQMITPHTEANVVVHDGEVRAQFDNINVPEKRKRLAAQIFSNHVTQDIICLQEASLLDKDTVIPNTYKKYCDKGQHNIIAWNKQRFRSEGVIKSINNRAFAVKLRDTQTNKIVLIATGHLSGCNPFVSENGDDAKGNNELNEIIGNSNAEQADVKIIAMDANVTASLPRLRQLKDAHYVIDHAKHNGPTCSNPNRVLDTKVDWIAAKGLKKIDNIPIPGVKLNDIHTNMSDHTPIAARITY